MLVYQRVSFILVLGRIHGNSVHQALHDLKWSLTEPGPRDLFDGWCQPGHFSVQPHLHASCNGRGGQDDRNLVVSQLCHPWLLTPEDLGLPGRGWRTQGSWSKAQNCIPKISQNRFEWSKIHWHNWAFHIFWMISACRSLLARMILILAPITHNEALAFCCEIQLVSTKEKPFWSLALGGILNYCRFIVFLDLLSRSF